MQDIIVKKVNLDQIKQLQQISRQTFWETFSDENNEKDMQKYLSENLSLEKLVAEYNNPNAQFYFAFSENKVIGYLKINIGSAQTELQEDNCLEIERIYVLSQFHGKNVGQILYEKAVQIAKEKNANYLWLGVWEKNLRAIRFYEKNGFRAFDKHIFVLGDDKQTDIMMKLTLYNA